MALTRPRKQSADTWFRDRQAESCFPPPLGYRKIPRDFYTVPSPSEPLTENQNRTKVLLANCQAYSPPSDRLQRQQGPGVALSSPLPTLTDTDTSPSSVASTDSVPGLFTPPPSSSPIADIPSDSETNSDSDYRVIATMNHDHLYAVCDIPAPNKLPIISEGILTPSVLTSAIEAIRTFCELKGIDDDDAVKQALACFKGEHQKGWIKKQRVVLVSLNLEEFFERLGTCFLAVNWELDVVRDRNNLRQGDDTFEAFVARIEELNALLDEVVDKKIVEMDIDKWTAAVRKADASLHRKLLLFEASVSKRIATGNSSFNAGSQQSGHRWNFSSAPRRDSFSSNQNQSSSSRAQGSFSNTSTSVAAVTGTRRVGYLDDEQREII
ncbi:hypothetical protein C8J56DRAFT_901267 [Mycena floridula]|nr:hypothetical protein C8J56DRAFT_901267 [Mycena floridula]